MALDSTDVYRIAREAANSVYIPDMSQFATIDELDSFADSTKEQVYLLRDEDAKIQEEINQLKEMMQEIIKENKELKQEVQKLKAKKSDKDYFSLDL